MLAIWSGSSKSVHWAVFGLGLGKVPKYGERVLYNWTASSCTSISSSCTSINFKIPAIDMSKLQNYPCCYKLKF